MDTDIAIDPEAQTRARIEDEVHLAYLRGYADARAKFERPRPRRTAPARTTAPATPGPSGPSGPSGADDGLEDFDFDAPSGHTATGDLDPDLDLDLGPEFAAALDAVLATTGPAFMPGSETITTGGVTYTRAGLDTRPYFPTRLRIEANRPLDKSEMTALHHLLTYNYRSTIRGNGIGRPRPDTDRSFVCVFDTVQSQRTDPNAACDDFENNLDAWLLDGSPIRTTNRAGAGTLGTRAVPGLGDPDLRVALYYDRVT